jgi:hypothetical protein
MKPEYFGDSYDIVKRFFVEILSASGYHVNVNPMLRGEWNGREKDFYRFIKASPDPNNIPGQKKALLIDPDTGISERKTVRHVTVECIAESLLDHDIVCSFDQSFQRGKDPLAEIKNKLLRLNKTGNFGFYYNSHARFLFASKSKNLLDEIERKLLKTGLPSSRLVKI